jgi:uncharacterized protein (TIGR03118 family)
MRNQFLKSVAVMSLLAAGISSAGAQFFKVTNIVSDGSVPATTTDANFINPWAISTSGTWWISAQGSGQNYVIPATGAISFRVVVPAASGLATATGLPSGSVTTGGAVGMLLPNATKASFLFSTLDGTISGWNSKLGTAGAISQIAINNSSAGAAYTGLAILNIATGGVTSTSYILAPNFGTANKVEVYDSTFQPTHLAGTFTDPNLPAGYSPYAIHVIGTQVFVTYALRSAAPFRTVNGAGNGVVDIFDNTGAFVSRAVTGGNLNSPWGVAIAPASFGVFSNDLLIGNFGDGIINVYDPKTFAYLGQLVDVAGKPLAYASLWELLPGGTTVTGTTGVSGGDTSTVYFTAGLANEAHGLFAGITNSTTVGSTPTFGFSASAGAVSVTAGNSVQMPFTVVPVNGFSGTVQFTCSGLPAGATCSFSPTSLAVSSTGVATSTVTVTTTKATAEMMPFHSHGHRSNGVVAAFLLPFASLLMFRQRKLRQLIARYASLPRVVGALAMVMMLGVVLVGCSSNGTPTVVPTPAGTGTVTLNATNGTVAQTTTFALTVK